MRISDWSSDVCSSDLLIRLRSKASCGSRALFNHGGILLRAAIHVANSAVPLLQIGGLTFGGGRNFSEQGAQFADPHDDLLQRLASPANPVDPASHLTGALARKSVVKGKSDLHR